MKRRHINPPVFFTSAGIILLLNIAGFFFTKTFEKGVNFINEMLTNYLGWFLHFSIGVFLLFTLLLLFSKYRNVKLGDDDSKPEYSYFSWLAMLFSAGMGIGILFYGVAEPMLHYIGPPVTAGADNAVTAMNYSFLHWGFHAWATYIIVSLSLAYFGFRKNMPLSIRSAFYPIFKDRIYGPIGHVIDVCAVIGTLFGVATSLGLGVMQINSGLNFLTGMKESTLIQVILICVITLCATISVVSGVNKGIKWLSKINISVGALLMLFILIAGPTFFILKSFLINMLEFAGDFLNVAVFNNFSINTEWKGSWTLFYWAWWISWAPYVGMFIARISRGRTIKEFIFGVLFVPSILSFLWLTVFGHTGIHLYNQGKTGLMNMVQSNIPAALFEFLSYFPLSELVNLLAVIIVITFFVTSSDSGSLVIDIITSGGSLNPLKKQKVFWSLVEGSTAIVLLLGGGLKALQTAVLTMAIPFSVILLIACKGLLDSIKSEGTRILSHKGRVAVPTEE